MYLFIYFLWSSISFLCIIYFLPYSYPSFGCTFTLPAFSCPSIQVSYFFGGCLTGSCIIFSYISPPFLLHSSSSLLFSLCSFFCTFFLCSFFSLFLFFLSPHFSVYFLPTIQVFDGTSLPFLHPPFLLFLFFVSLFLFFLSFNPLLFLFFTSFFINLLPFYCSLWSIYPSFAAVFLLVSFFLDSYI